MKHSYYMNQRPPMPGAMPRKGLVGIDEYDHPRDVDGLEHVYAVIIYNRKLTNDEINQYELTPVEREFAMNRIDICTVIMPGTNERVPISLNTTDHNLYCGDVCVEDGFDFQTKEEAAAYCEWVYYEDGIELID